MAKYFDKIGFAIFKEIKPGVWNDEDIIELNYSGDIVKNNRRLQSADKVNDNIIISNEISIIADSFAIENIYNIRFVTFKGKKWKASVVDVQSPRLILSLGGLYIDDE